ncbi:MAG: hypothetical protein JNL38_01065 [Myxococcales bacterium]|jgi:hypothetical protein|nr:hypothetical protein [Myxococcales bacterium]
MVPKSVHPFAVLSALLLSACSTDPGLPTFQTALNEALRDEAALSKLCKRPISQADANAVRATMAGKPATQPNEASFPQFSSSRSVLGKDGTGRTDIVYVPRQGAPCTGEMTFAFHQGVSGEKVGKRGMKYTSQIDLSNVVITPK